MAIVRRAAQRGPSLFKLSHAPMTALHAEFRRRGFCRPSVCLDTAELDALRAACDALLAEQVDDGGVDRHVQVIGACQSDNDGFVFFQNRVLDNGNANGGRSLAGQGIAVRS